MSDTINLACGLEMRATGVNVTPSLWTWSAPGASFWLSESRDGTWDAWTGNDGDESLEDATREECLAWLNARVEELVSSLGAVIVPEDARERIERAIVDRRLALGKDDEGLRHEIGGHPHASWVEKEYASAVLAALGMVRR